MKLHEKKLQLQKPMVRVSYALIPLILASIYLFGWRSLAIIAVVFVFGIAAEGLFTFKQGKPITSAVFVTCLIFSLSLPPTIPLWMAIIGIVVGVILGKMVFGGFGQNVFNPAMVGRCFIYITFPLQMTNQWIEPFKGGWAGFSAWSQSADALTQATPMVAVREGGSIPLLNLFLGNTSGSMGETSALLIILGGMYIIYKKAAPWRLAISCLLGGIALSSLLNIFSQGSMPVPWVALLSGSFLFGTFFVATEPISGSKTKPGQWIYGFMIGGLTMVLRAYSNFAEGMMFSVLIMNAFVPLIDQIIRRRQKPKKAAE